MREIRFRALYNGHLVYGNFIEGVFDGIEFYQIEQSDSRDFSKWLVDKETVGQYTGRQDKNGKYIYEGDIVEFDAEEWGNDQSNKFEVCWDDYNAGWDFGGGITSDMEYRTVIGNIHENPELLENGEL
jgi:hypothetical protein